jgi:hypothetical protein
MVETTHWQQTKGTERTQFIVRDMLWSLLFNSIVLIAVAVFGDHRSPLRVMLLTSAIVFPILLLLAYLRARRKWLHFERKYRDDLSQGIGLGS